MSELFGVDVSGLIAEHVGPGVFDATLIKITRGARVSGKLTQGVPKTRTSSSGKGFVETYDDRFIDGTLIKSSDRKITLIADTFPSGIVPNLKDEITIQGLTYTIVGDIKSDPANATYECQSRR